MTDQTETPPNPVLQAIDDLVERKTFGLDALDAIKKLRDKAVKQDTMLAYQDREIVSERNKNHRLQAEIEHKQKELVGWKEREAAITEREKKQSEIELSAAVAREGARVYGLVFDKVFANRIVREESLQSRGHVVLNPGSSYPTTHTTSDRDTTERTEG